MTEMKFIGIHRYFRCSLDNIALGGTPIDINTREKYIILSILLTWKPVGFFCVNGKGELPYHKNVAAPEGFEGRKFLRVHLVDVVVFLECGNHCCNSFDYIVFGLNWVKCAWTLTVQEPDPGGGRGILLGILGRGVPPGSPNPDPISLQNIPFSTPVFRPGL